MARRWWQMPRMDPRVFDAVVAAVLLALLVLSFPGRVMPGQRPADGAAWLLAIGLSAPYAVHRRYPSAALAVALAALVAWSAAHFAPYPALGVFAVLFGITLHGGRRRESVISLVATLVALVAALALQPPGVAGPSDWAATLLAALVAWLGAHNLRQRRLRWAALEERALLVERERAERERAAVAAERLRIARELHDVVAHSMSLIAVQAGVGAHVIDTDVASARAALDVIESTSRDALTEMRRMLGVLRDGTEPVDVRPAHGLADLDDLVAEVRRSGLGVLLDRPADVRLPASLDLTAYRVVQESLTNVLRHGGPVAHVRLGMTDDCMTIEVTDEGRTSAERRDAPVESGGHGLAGMRERIALYGGTFEAGPLAGGGFRVRAVLPRVPASR
ncbi:sensor histidine kinase [Intrasporangium mesophilum]